MDRKPPRPRTLTLTPPSGKKQTKMSRQKKASSWVSKSERQMDLHYLADDIKGIIKGITFEKSSENAGATRESYLRSRSYIGVSSVDDPGKRHSRRSDIVSSFYREREDRDNHTREMHVARMAGLQDSYSRDRSSDHRTELRTDLHQKSSKRISCPWDMYFDNDRDESRTLQLLAKELRHVQEIRDTEVRDLLALNAKLQDDLYDSERELYTLQGTNGALERRVDEMLQVYERIKGNLKRCLTKVKGLEQFGKLTGNYSDDEVILRTGKGNGDGDVSSISSGFNTQSDVSENISLGPGYEGDGEGSICADIGKQLDEAINGNGLSLPRKPDPTQEPLKSRPSTPSKEQTLASRSVTSSKELNQTSEQQQLFVGRLQSDVNSLSQINKDQAQEIDRLRNELVTCRKHMMTSQFQLEAVEIECSRLLSMEDQLITVITLLKRARDQHIHRQILGDIVTNAVTMTMSLEDYTSSGQCVETFLRELQEQLSGHPILITTEVVSLGNMEGATASTRSALSGVERVTRENRSLLENIRFIDDEEAGQGSDNDSFHSLGKHLNDHEHQESPPSV